MESRIAILDNKSVRAGLALALLASAAGLVLYLLGVKSEYEAVTLRARATEDLFALYELQRDYRKRHGRYAQDLETLLSVAPDRREALRRRLEAHAHLDTLVVAGTEWKFRLEANARDGARTLIRLNGPRAGDPIRPR